MNNDERKLLYSIYDLIKCLSTIIDGDLFIKSTDEIYDKLQLLYSRHQPEYYPKENLMLFEDMIHNEIRNTYMSYLWFRKKSHVLNCQLTYMEDREKTIEKIICINRDLLVMIEELKKD